MTKFWGTLFGINFAMGVATGVTMEFQFGTNWAHYSHYVGDVFGAPLAIEGLMAFFLEATFVGLFFFGWKRLTKVQHLVVTWLVALGSNFRRCGFSSPTAGCKIRSAPLSIRKPCAWSSPPSSRCLQSGRPVEIRSHGQRRLCHRRDVRHVHRRLLHVTRAPCRRARRSIAVAASFGLASALSVVVLGDESGYTAGFSQKMKIAAIEAMWETEPPPASFTLFGVPDIASETTKYEVRIPWLLGLIATRSFDQPVEGIKPLIARAEQRIRDGLPAYAWLERRAAARPPRCPPSWSPRCATSATPSC